MKDLVILMTPLNPAYFRHCEAVKHAVISSSMLSVKMNVKDKNISNSVTSKRVKLISL